MTSDERIGRYLDHEMDMVERAAFETEMSRDAGLAAQVARWRTNDHLLATAVPAPPVDDALMARLGLSASANLDGAVSDTELMPAGNVIAIADARQKKEAVTTRWRWAAGATALAASLALALLLRPAAPSASANQAFQTALSETPSGTARPIGDNVVLTPSLTLAQTGGGFCREFRLSGRQNQRGLACRSEAEWQVIALVDSAAPDDPGEIVAAGGEADSQIDRAIDARTTGDPLSQGAERRAISADWQ